jgi:phospholipid/cholesterol/gamma-HCH transport system substrate-binding protein
MRRNGERGMSSVRAGALLLVVTAIVTYFGFAKEVPFRHHFTIAADFRTSNNLRPDSPVRIAGVNVGKVTGVEQVRRGESVVRVTMRIDGKGLPIHKDATARIRPRIFLEGNFFVDIQPGTPSSPTLGDGDVLPAAQTSTPVQLDQVLTVLQTDARGYLRRLLREYGRGLSGPGGAGFNASIRHWAPAYRNAAIVNDATLGSRPGDLSGYISAQATVAAALDSDPDALRGLITDFNTTAAAFAVQQTRLEEAVAELPRTLRAAEPALASLNAAFPPLRRLVVDLRPAVRSSGPTIDAGMPFLRQARPLVSRAELRGLVADLRPTVPSLARLTAASVPLLRQVRAASSCQNEVILPWSRDRIEDDAFPPSGPVFEEGVKWLPGVASESRSGDPNSQWFHTLAGNGNNTYQLGRGIFGNTNFPLRGVNPPRPDPSPIAPNGRPPISYGHPCETQERPDLRSIAGPPPPMIAADWSLPGVRALDARYRAAATDFVRDALAGQGGRP